MNIYDILHLIQKESNLDRIQKILDGWQFQTSVRTAQVLEEVKTSAIELANLGENKLYEFIKQAYGLKM